MSWHSRKSHGARPVALAAAVAGIILLGVAGGASADAATSGPGSAQSVAYNGCSPGYPYRIYFYSNGELVPDLVVCTNWWHSVTTITNTSDSVIWHVNQPWDPNWTFGQDPAGPLNGAVLLYRTWLNVISSPHQPIEPGVTVTLYTSPGEVQLGHNAGEQAAWQMASLMADSTADKGREAFIGILKDNASPIGKAVIECANDAYSIGQSLYGEDQPQDIQSQLSAELGIYQNGASCGQAIDDAQHVTESHGGDPLMTLEGIQKEAHLSEEWNTTDSVVRDAVTFIKLGARVQELH